MQNTLYGNLGSTTYQNGIVVAKNTMPPANWGIMDGDNALANNFYVANPEFFGGHQFADMAYFTYS